MRLKTILGLVFAAIIVVFSIQNARVIEISFLFWKLEASTVLVILGSFIIGILVGVLLSLKRKTKSKTLL